MKRLLILFIVAGIAGACKDSPSGPEPPPVSSKVDIGDLLTLNVQTEQGKACSEADNRVGRVAAITQRAIVVADTANPRGGFTDEEYRSLGITFDTLIYPLVVDNFGEPQDVDGNGRVIIFYTRAVNELTPAGQNFYIGGFFFSRDLFPKQGNESFEACQTSNQAEMFYMLVPDPRGEVNGNARTTGFIDSVTVTTLAHEFQHLINASRRLYVVRVDGSDWNEQVWLNEGLSHIAEELLGYRVGGLASGENIDVDRLRESRESVEAFNLHHIANFDRLITYLEHPDTVSVLGGTDPDGRPVDNLAVRGAVWQFLRYAADRKGGSEASLWRNLVASDRTGLENLHEVLGTDPMDWLRDWSVSVYTDDAGLDVDTRFTHPSWDFRSIIPAISDGTFPLRTQTLTEGDNSFTVRGAGAIYLRFRVPPLRQAELRVADFAGSCTQAGALEIGEVFLVEGDDAGAVCIDGGSLGAEFVYIPFFASEVGNANLAMDLRASGIGSVTGSVGPSRRPRALMLPDNRTDTGTGGGPLPDRGWEMRLREREIRELSPLVPGGMAAVTALNVRQAPSMTVALQTSTGAVDSRLRIAIVRTH